MAKKSGNAKKTKSTGQLIGDFFKWLGNDIKDIGVTFKEGDWATRISYLILGFGPIVRKSFLRGFAFLAMEILFFVYMVQFGWGYLSKMYMPSPDTKKFVGLPHSLGNVETTNKGGLVKYGDDSFFILLFGIMTIIIICAFIILWRMNLRENKNEQKLLAAGKKIPSAKEDFHSLFDSNFDKTLMAFPVIGVFFFLVVPIIFMICVAFTNYDKTHNPPTHLISWVGLANFKELFSSTGASALGPTFFKVLGWTLIWAFFATFLNYFLGMGVAMLINKKGIKFKKMWRTILVVTIAVPQFISLLYVGKMFANDGMINHYLMQWGIIKSAIPFWDNPILAKVMIIVLNCWIGIPYLMLIATGLLMNIPEDLYESARIDGANGFQMFKSITLPYMLFVTGPYLLTSFTGNLNNFNVIYLLTTGRPKGMGLAGNAGHTDLLITWLYTLTVSDNNYKIAACIGIMVFVVTAVISLVVYSMLPSVKDEEGFQ